MAKASMWIPVEQATPRPGALVWAAVAGRPELWKTPVLARRRLGIFGSGPLWQDVRSGRRLDAGNARVTHWRPLEAPEPP